jgi:hypothetical protein
MVFFNVQSSSSTIDTRRSRTQKQDKEDLEDKETTRTVSLSCYYKFANWLFVSVHIVQLQDNSHPSGVQIGLTSLHVEPDAVRQQYHIFHGKE